MAKFRGKVGYIFTEEKLIDGEESGIWEEKYVEKTYYGNVLTLGSRLTNVGHLNDDIVITNRLSIVADPFAYENFQHIKYAIYMSHKWKVESVEVQQPRLILNLGGVYNEDPNGFA